MRRVGMRKEPHFVSSLWFQGEWVDDIIFAMLASDWKAMNGKMNWSSRCEIAKLLKSSIIVKIHLKIHLDGLCV